MIDKGNIRTGKLPVFKFAVLLIMVISILYTSIFAWINNNVQLLPLTIDIFLTFAIEFTIASMVYGIITLVNQWLPPVIIRWWRYPLELALIMVLSFWVLHTIHLLVRDDMYQLSAENEAIDYRMFITVNMAGSFFIYSLISSMTLYQVMLDKSKQAEKLQKEYAQVRLQALKSQVNPHFLFNSLSVLSSLVHLSPETSERFIIQLSKAYRYILEQKNTDLVTLKDELDFLDAFYYLLQIRFEKKIILEKQIGSEMLDWLLPPFTLQLLVENAVKHNKMSAARPLVIRIMVSEEMILVVNNRNRREETVDSTGIGLDNIKKRVSYLTDHKVVVWEDSTAFRVGVPLLKSKQS
ncbi:sensor histidine kinase [Flavihumibacter stibioxidans]|uniref:Signal transduction histidine kinase internal region domain-containing protein n=1 Tax=Flavihumibacter stibioxidans TaxID=1834163 RepID=A0ABR7MCM8_9BACT|nr:histidine kinase [Flavihumibacter stibioxidans]MBC6492785.1 hypothetical protein [Flavihumibacter stibioxidans]